MTTKRTTRTEELAKKDVAHFFHPIGRIKQAPTLIWERGEGTQLWDTDGKQYTDMSSGGVHCTSLGFGNKELNKAICEQVDKIAHMFAAPPMSNVQAIEYATELAEVLPGDINHLYFGSIGTEANEIAFQIARLFWESQGQPNRYKVMCLTRSYHGGSVFTRSLTGVMGMSGFGQASPGIVRLPNYHCHRCHLGLQYPGCDIACARFVEKVIEEEGADTILAFIAEPVQGAAGVVWPPDEYWPMVKKILSNHNILFIADEVQSGFCRTGKFWGVDNWNIVPDIMTMSKGINSSYLPLAAVGFSDRINDALPDSLVFASGTTASANSAVMASGRAALKIFKGEKLAERSAKLGAHLHERLVKEFLPLPCVGDVMGRGLFQSFEIALNKTTGRPFNLEAAIKARESIFSRCLEKGVFAAKYDGYPRRQCVCPALVITEAELDAALDAMLSVMKEVKPA